MLKHQNDNFLMLINVVLAICMLNLIGQRKQTVAIAWPELVLGNLSYEPQGWCLSNEISPVS